MEDDQRVCRAHAFTQALFLLLSLVLSELPHPEAKPLDFVCVGEARKVMNKVKDLQQDLTQCSSAAFLPAPVRIPCIRVNLLTWKSKPIPERGAEILQSLRMLAQDIHQARNGSQAECALRLLGRLEHNINNYIHTLRQLHAQSGLDGPKVPEISVQSVTQDLSRVLQHFDRLISRKLEWLVSEMAKECETKTDT
ncbi:thrombopoietin [Ictalurus punctatus]|uniref:Thrombopoietin n=1 Tax=Ictalurus punctatus TaxID=7998 RepID=A0A2D0T719_ICTPU|nr:thrombopoietin [Ictalurus punctatus]